MRLPYHVSIRELRRDVHESGEYEDTGDYRLIENFYVSSLEEVQTILDKYDLSLEEAKYIVVLKIDVSKRRFRSRNVPKQTAKSNTTM